MTKVILFVLNYADFVLFVDNNLERYRRWSEIWSGVALGNLVPNGKGIILINDVKCSGAESKLRYCSYLRNPNCSHTEDVGIACLNGVNGGRGNWFSWSKCGAFCGTGIQHRYRSCNKQVPNNGGKPCVGLPVTTKSCQSQNCSDVTYQIINGGWSTWFSWSSCSVTCGEGIQHRYRKCNNPIPNNGLYCPGPIVTTTTCKTTDCLVTQIREEIVDGGWSAWYNWSSCSVTCGKGVQHRYRKCDNPVPNHNGSYCFGDIVTTHQCSLNKCSGRTKEITDVKLKWCSTEIFAGVAAGCFVLPMVCWIMIYVIRKKSISTENKDSRGIATVTDVAMYNTLHNSQSEIYDVVDDIGSEQNGTDTSQRYRMNVNKKQTYENVKFNKTEF